jgi:hypothetical protein
VTGPAPGPEPGKPAEKPDKPVALLVPIGPLDREETEAMLRVARKALGIPVESAPPMPLPPGCLDGARGQIVAGRLLAAVPAIVEAPPPPPAHSTYGGAPAPLAARPAPPPAAKPPFARVGVIDHDLYMPGHEFLFLLADAKGRRAVTGLRRLREAFYKRKADPARQRARAAREFLCAMGAARGLPPCADPGCVMWDAHSVLEIDRKGDRFCGPCNNHIHGRMRW